MERPLASIIIRTYNEERHIGRLLDGIFQQTVKDIEVILVDSGSTDTTLSIARRYPVNICSIRPEDFSFGYSLNCGCRDALGTYLVFASGHVYPVRQDWLENLLSMFADPKVALVYGKQRGDHTSKFSEHQIFHKLFPDKTVYAQDSCFCNNANAAIRRHLWEKVPYDETLTGLEDLDWAKQAMNMGHCISYCAQAEVIHTHEESSSQIYNRYKREAIALKRIFPDDRFGLWDFARLLILNMGVDYYHAYHAGKLRQKTLGIATFRLMQFWGTYRGFRFRKAVSPEMKRKFFYPARHRRPAVRVATRVVDDSLELLCPRTILTKRNRKVFREIEKLQKLYLNLQPGWNYSLDYTWILQNIDFKPDMLILDFGCGRGGIHAYIEEVYGYNVIGIDRVRTPLAEHVVDVDGDKLPFPDNYFNIVYAASSLEHNEPEKIKKCYREIIRVLQPGGRLIATLSASNNDHYFPPSDSWNLSEKTLCSIFELEFEEGSLEQIRKEYRRNRQLRRKYKRRYGSFGPDDPAFVVAGILKTKKYTPPQTFSPPAGRPEPAHTAALETPGGQKPTDESRTRRNYPVDYDFREDPLPRPLSNVSLGEVFGWFFGTDFLPLHPHVHPIAEKCRTDPGYVKILPDGTRASSERETGHAIYSIVRLLKPKNVIEIGCYNGASSICIAKALQDNGFGILHAVDISSTNIEITKRNLENADLTQWVQLYHGDSSDHDVLDRLSTSEFIFIDGDHSYEGAKRDFENYQNKLDTRGIMLFHDTIKIMALRHLIQEIYIDGRFDVFTVATSDGDGITFLKRKTVGGNVTIQT